MATYLSRKGLKKLQAEHKQLIKSTIDLTEEVNKAAALGDLRENAEYHAARERLQHVAARLQELDAKLGDVIITDDLEIAEGEVRIGTRVILEDVQTKRQDTYLMVGADEADPAEGRLSIESPMAKSMLGKKAGESFTLKLPRAVVPYKVIKVERA